MFSKNFFSIQSACSFFNTSKPLSSPIERFRGYLLSNGLWNKTSGRIFSDVASIQLIYNLNSEVTAI